MLSIEIRSVVRNIAATDGISFRQAMIDYQYLEKTLSLIRTTLIREANREKGLSRAEIEVQVQDHQIRILRTRKMLGITLREAVKSFDPTCTEYGEKLEKPRTKKCTYKGCRNQTSATSYYWCDRHRQDLGSDDGVTNYCHWYQKGDGATSWSKTDKKTKKTKKAAAL